MIKKKEEMQNVEIEHMRDGDGIIYQQRILGENDMAKHARLFANMRIRKGCSIGPHDHVNETEYYYILSGEGIVAEADGEKTVKAGDVVITGGGASHAIRNEKDEDLVFIAIIILD